MNFVKGLIVSKFGRLCFQVEEDYYFINTHVLQGVKEGDNCTAQLFECKYYDNYKGSVYPGTLRINERDLSKKS